MRWLPSGYSRLWVHLCRLFFWTLAARREETRIATRFIVDYDRIRPGIERVQIKATGGSTIKNVYVETRLPPVPMHLWLHIWNYEKFGRLPRVPKT